ncbi:hypothetical protein Tco_0985659 [Tanacetum coccineum]
MPPKKTPMTDAAIKELIAQGVADALVDYEANRSSGNGHDSQKSGSGGGRTLHTACVCTYKNFLNCQPFNFKGTEGVVGLTLWFEKMEFTVGHDATYGVPWSTLMKIMTDKYYLRCEIKKLEIKLWNLKVEKYVGELPDMIQGNVMLARPKTMREAIELENDLIDQNVRTFTERQAENKRRLDNNPRDNHIEQPPYKRPKC